MPPGVTDCAFARKGWPMTFPPKNRTGRSGRPAAPASKPASTRSNAPRSSQPAVPAKRALAQDGSEREGERIAKLLARAGVASRREVERMIEEGRVRIGDEVVTTPNGVKCIGYAGASSRLAVVVAAGC